MQFRRRPRQRQTTPAFKELYAQRAGVEGTISKGIRAFGLRRSRYCGQPKTHLQHVRIGASLNFVRWGSGSPTYPAPRPVARPLSR